jgi:3'-phosphoadenosine 5'-phosphosulfate sulfotransferase (PAPS reductase)/FAD synthetase
MAGLALADRLKAARAGLPGRIAFTTRFGLEDQAITHAVFSERLAIEVLTLDTGRCSGDVRSLEPNRREIRCACAKSALI